MPAASADAPLEALIVGVYRKRNARVLDEVLRPACDVGFEVRLWALDEVDEELAPVTVGEGAGGKFALVNRLIAARDVESRQLVVVDDDFRFSRRTIVDFLSIMRRCRLDLAQPAHDRGSFWTHPITRAEPFSVARETTFVEIGPIFAVSPDWISRATPFPELGMGWGLELDWLQLQQEGCRLGIVDRTRITHLAPVAQTYGKEIEGARVKARFRSLGISGWADVQQTLRRWRPWHRLG